MEAPALTEPRIVGLLQDQIFRDGHIPDQALQIPVFRHVADAIFDEAVGVEHRHAAALDMDLAALRCDNAGDELRQLRLAVAVDAGDADDLAAVNLEGQIVQAAVLAFLIEVDMIQLCDDLAAVRFDLFILRDRQLLADHHAGKLLPVRF